MSKIKGDEDEHVATTTTPTQLSTASAMLDLSVGERNQREERLTVQFTVANLVVCTGFHNGASNFYLISKVRPPNAFWSIIRLTQHIPRYETHTNLYSLKKYDSSRKIHNFICLYMALNLRHC